MTVDESAAREAAQRLLDTWPSPDDIDDEVTIWDVEEHTRAWVVHFGSCRWVRTRDFGAQLVGACPLIVDKVTGEVHLYGSGPDGHRQFKAWLDTSN